MHAPVWRSQGPRSAPLLLGPSLHACCDRSTRRARHRSLRQLHPASRPTARLAYSNGGSSSSTATSSSSGSSSHEASSSASAQYGVFVCSGSPLVAEALAHSGVDWLCLDTQHGAVGYGELLRLLQATCSAPRRPQTIVRVGGPSDRFGIQQALDQGADGVMVPLVNTVAEAVEAVSYCRYPPQGCRSLVAPSRAILVQVPSPPTASHGTQHGRLNGLPRLRLSDPCHTTLPLVLVLVLLVGAGAGAAGWCWCWCCWLVLVLVLLEGVGGAALGRYLQSANSRVQVWLQVESLQCLESLDAMLDAVAPLGGVDCLFVGPADLAVSMGLLGGPGPLSPTATQQPSLQQHKQLQPPAGSSSSASSSGSSGAAATPPDLAAALAGPEMAAVHERVIATCRERGVAPGCFCVGPARAKELAEMGYTRVGFDTDLGMLINSATAAIKAL
ncbi:hypothetical protein HYH02_007890 [Chlamydomonas schloesseri]|uniref:HpcH/HpaI aldolase/citrate lyase domain-containing protein n=1 Tax=Chlamydomonas schloesseri TaxID=2026947 RepID=A0A836B4L9_9CHLO|nr:hypothetical protein HYH02_007890 [Chlamydomonas schloesseri]|eukprot:KAG2447144.1 hypothetical protein HYH02_007890 [Chlamydomonas schloesseri]